MLAFRGAGPVTHFGDRPIIAPGSTLMANQRWAKPLLSRPRKRKWPIATIVGSLAGWFWARRVRFHARRGPTGGGRCTFMHRSRPKERADYNELACGFTFMRAKGGT